LPAVSAARVSATCFGERKRESSAIFYRPVGKAVGERVEVLFGEQRGRHEHHDLLAFVYSNKRRP